MMTMPLIEPLLKALFPPRCAACRVFVGDGVSLCEACESAWPALDSPFCTVCAEPFVAGPDHRCGRCREESPAFDLLRAVGRYEGLLLDLVVRLKYRGEERLASFLGGRMATVAERSERSFDLILPIPLHVAKLRKRGFNQAVLLARRIGKKLGAPVDPLLLRKTRPTPAQATLSYPERRTNLKGAFVIEEAERVRDREILLVDDVATTGTTLDEAARALKRAGAARVEALVAARAARER